MKVSRKIIAMVCDFDCDNECDDDDKCLSCEKIFCWEHEGREEGYCYTCRTFERKDEEVMSRYQ